MAIGATAAAIVAFGIVATKSAIEAADAHLKLQNTFKNNASLADSSVAAFERQADALRDLTGVDDEAIITSQALLGQFKLTGAEVQKLTPLVVDLSSKMDIDLQSAAKAVGKATQGSTGILSRYGIVLDETSVQADSFNAVMEGLQGTVGGFAKQRAINEPWRILGAQLEELAEEVGKALLPVFRDLATTLKDLLPIIAALLGPIADLISLAARAISALANLLTLDFEELRSGFVGAATTFETLVKQYEAGAITALELDNRLRKLQETTGTNVQLTQEYELAIANARDSQQRASQASNEWNQILENQEQQTDDTANAVSHLTAEMREQRLEVLAATNAFLAIELAARDVSEAQRELNRLERQGKEDTKAYEEATLDALAAQIQMEEAVFAFGKQLAETDTPQRKVIEKIQQMGRELGISKGNLDDIISRIKDYINELNRIPEEQTTNIRTVFTSSGRPAGGFTGPQLQHGGVVERTGLAVVHRGEVFSGVNNEMGFGGVNITVNGWVGNDQQLARKIRDELNKLGGRNAGTGLN